MAAIPGKWSCGSCLVKYHKQFSDDAPLIHLRVKNMFLAFLLRNTSHSVMLICLEHSIPLLLMFHFRMQRPWDLIGCQNNKIRPSKRSVDPEHQQYPEHRGHFLGGGPKRGLLMCARLGAISCGLGLGVSAGNGCVYKRRAQQPRGSAPPKQVVSRAARCCRGKATTHLTKSMLGKLT